MSLRDYLFHEEPGITLYCGDAYALLPLLPTRCTTYCLEACSGLCRERVLLLTDPPYGINSVRPDGRMGGSVAATNGVYLRVHGDDKPLDPTPLIGIGARQIIWGADHFTTGAPAGGRLLVWDKRDGMASNDFADAEIAWDSKGGPCRVIRHRQVGMLHDGYGDVDRVHPNQKPLRVMSWCLRMAPEATVVLDPFCGSGTTIRAAKDAGIPAIGIEIEPRYCEIAVKRLRQEVLPL